MQLSSAGLDQQRHSSEVSAKNFGRKTLFIVIVVKKVGKTLHERQIVVHDHVYSAFPETSEVCNIAPCAFSVDHELIIFVDKNLRSFRFHNFNLQSFVRPYSKQTDWFTLYTLQIHITQSILFLLLSSRRFRISYQGITKCCSDVKNPCPLSGSSPHHYFNYFSWGWIYRVSQ